MVVEGAIGIVSLLKVLQGSAAQDEDKYEDKDDAVNDEASKGSIGLTEATGLIDKFDRILRVLLKMKPATRKNTDWAVIFMLFLDDCI